MGDESDALNDWADYSDEDLLFKPSQRHQMTEAYNKNIVAKNGEKVTCPGCLTCFIKTNKKVFCSNKGKGNCKDAYWNVISLRKASYKRY